MIEHLLKQRGVGLGLEDLNTNNDGQDVNSKLLEILDNMATISYFARKIHSMVYENKFSGSAVPPTP